MQRVLMAAGALFALCCVCAGMAAIISASDTKGQPTFASDTNAFTIEQAISYTQTAGARLSTPTPQPTDTPIPRATETATLVFTAAPSTDTTTSSPQPTSPILPSDTPLVPVSGDDTTSTCDPSYPTVCIPPHPPDLNCRDVEPYKNFQVLPPDPHEFDGNKDGVGCES
jgi:hypothetical protein